MLRTAFLAHSGIWNVDAHVVSKVKLASLLCERIVHSGTPEPLLFAEISREVHGEPVLSSQTKAAIAQTWLRVPDATPKFEPWLREQDNLVHAKQQSSPLLQLATAESLLKHGFSAREQYDDYKLQLYTIAEIVYWRRHLADSMFIGHSISDTALRILSEPVVEVDGLLQALSPLPDVLPLTWNDVFGLRSSHFFKAFRSKVAELQASGNLQNLRELYQEGLEAIAQEVSPAPVKTATLAILANLPIPGNPLHLAESILEVRDQWKMSKHFGWVFFIQQARALGKRAAE